jgi:single-strand DNA-binding protein
MSAFELTGNLVEVMPAQTFAKGFRKREFVIETLTDKYPQMIIFQLVQDKCDMIDSFGPGDTIRVSFEIKGREYNGRYFNALEAWRIFGEKRASEPAEEIDVFNDPELFPEKNKPTIRRSDLVEAPAAGQEDDLPF